MGVKISDKDTCHCKWVGMGCTVTDTDATQHISLFFFLQTEELTCYMGLNLGLLGLLRKQPFLIKQVWS